MPVDTAVAGRLADDEIAGLRLRVFARKRRGGQYERREVRVEDRDEALDCLKKQGGLEACTLTFYSDEDLGDDGVWDNWRLEGPSFVWYFRGTPHVHVWVNVADSADIPANARG